MKNLFFNLTLGFISFTQSGSKEEPSTEIRGALKSDRLTALLGTWELKILFATDCDSDKVTNELEFECYYGRIVTFKEGGEPTTGAPTKKPLQVRGNG